MSGYDNNDNQDDAYGLEPEYDPREHAQVDGQLQDQIQVEILPIENVPCKQCGYDLSGLFETGRCPECAYPVERSLTEDLLEFSSPGYLASLHLGVILILTALTLKFIFFFSKIVFGMNGGNMNVLEFGALIADFLAAILVGIGWWKFSEPDPAFTGQLDGSTSRKVVRVITLIIAGIAVIKLPAQLMPGNTVMETISAMLSMLSFVAWITGFYAAMTYLRWLSPRIPEWRIFKRSAMLMWLEPILWTVGSLCIMIGPLVGFVLYWNLLNWVRLELKAIRKQADLHSAQM